MSAEKARIESNLNASSKKKIRTLDDVNDFAKRTNVIHDDMWMLYHMSQLDWLETLRSFWKFGVWKSFEDAREQSKHIFRHTISKSLSNAISSKGKQTKKSFEDEIRRLGTWTTQIMKRIAGYIGKNQQKASIGAKDDAGPEDNTAGLYFLEHILIYGIFANVKSYRIITFPRLVPGDVLKAKVLDKISSDIKFKHNTSSTVGDEVPTSDS